MQIVKQHALFSLLLSRLPESPKIVEVGGFTGNHTLQFIKKKPHAEIHAFEPVPSLFETLQKNTAAFPSIFCYPDAVSDHNGAQTLFLAHNPKHSGLVSPASSLHRPHKRTLFSPMMYTETIEVSCITLEHWYTAHKMNTLIDLLWIDAQGHEFHVLRGAQNLLAFVSYIHVEVHFNQAYENQTDYTDVIAFLETQGFVEIARDFSDTKNWFFGNSLFERKNQLPK